MRNIIILLTLLAFTSCSEDFVATYCTDEKGNNWLDDKIKELKRNSMDSEVYYYEYKGESVFSISDCTNCADAMTQVYNCEGVVICQFGGIAGLNTCPDFASLAKNERLLYSKK